MEGLEMEGLEPCYGKRPSEITTLGLRTVERTPGPSELHGGESHQGHEEEELQRRLHG